jgi:hypothetical protein
VPANEDGLFFVNKKSHDGELAGFFLAIRKSQGCAVMEAFDTWLHPEVSFEDFQKHVTRDNPGLTLKSGQDSIYTTFNGNRVHFVIWNSLERDNHVFGSKVTGIEYGPGNPSDTLAGAGNDTARFLSGTVLNSPRDAVVEISNAFLGMRITLDLFDPFHPKRTSETGEVEEAGLNHQVWVDFDSPSNIPEDGDFYHPFKTLARARDAVAVGGTVWIVPGSKNETLILNKPMKLDSFTGSAVIGRR